MPKDNHILQGVQNIAKITWFDLRVDSKIPLWQLDDIKQDLLIFLGGLLGWMEELEVSNGRE